MTIKNKEYKEDGKIIQSINQFLSLYSKTNDFVKIFSNLVLPVFFNVLKILIEQRRELFQICNEIKKARIIITSGSGRSGYISQFFAQRLAHALQKVGKVFYATDTTAPPLSEDCLIIMATGSGTTGTEKNRANRAKANGATLVVFTTFLDSPIAEKADYKIEVPGRNTNEEEDVLPLGTKFEITLLIIYEIINAYIIIKDKVSSEKLNGMHRNYE